MIQIALIAVILGFALYVTGKLFKGTMDKENQDSDNIMGSGGTDEDPKPPYQHDRDTK